MAVDGAGVGELLDALGQLADTEQPEREPGRARPGGQFENLAGSWGRPVACTLPAAAVLLGVPEAQVRKAAKAVEPYTHANGSPRWSLMLLERQLGQRPKPRRGTGTGSPWRWENRVTYQRQYGPDP